MTIQEVGRAEEEYQRALMSPGDNHSLQLIRVFGVRMPEIEQDIPTIDPLDIYGISRRFFRGSGDLQRPYETVIRMMFLDFVAFSVSSSHVTLPPPVHIYKPIKCRMAAVSCPLSIASPRLGSNVAALSHARDKLAREAGA